MDLIMAHLTLGEEGEGIYGVENRFRAQTLPLLCLEDIVCDNVCFPNCFLFRFRLGWRTDIMNMGISYAKLFCLEHYVLHVGSSQEKSLYSY